MTFELPGYRIDHLLGRGSQAEVWLGVELASGERVALKRFPADSAASCGAGQAEAGVLASLDHPNLIGFRGLHRCGSGAVLVLELAEGGSLASLLRRRDRLTAAEVVAALTPIAAALAHAHEAGVVHGDLSPANILFTAAGHPKLADLGLARLSIGADRRLGTPAYLDPTIAAGGAAGLASDVFSLGAVALQALTGAGPWLLPGAPMPSADQVLAVAARGIIPDLAARLASSPPAIAALVIRALNVEPSQRGTAAEFALDLRAALPPRPVALSGGRILPPVGRHSVDYCSREQRPFLDPDRSGPSFVPADLTQVSRPQVRAALDATAPGAGNNDPVRAAADRSPLPRRLFDSARHRMIGGSRLRGAAVLALLGLFGLAGVLGWSTLFHRATNTAGRSITAQPTAPQRSLAQPSASQGPTTQARRTQGLTAQPSAVLQPAELLHALASLDAVRAQAFAQRRPELLTAVYASKALLAADTTELNGMVPAGCQLPGLHSSYRQLSTRSSGPGTATVRVLASLPAAQLHCSGRVAGRTQPVAPQWLDVTLIQTPAGPRIAGQELASG
jgi:hypothetical protein